MANHIIQHPVPLVLKKILKEKSNGELIVKGDNFYKNLYFIESNLIFAKTNVIQERLGEILFKLGKINRSQFLNIFKLIEGKTLKLGEILVQNKILSQQEIISALYYQMRTIATSTFVIAKGEWDFIEKHPEIPDDSQFKIELPNVIIEGINRLENISYFKNRFCHQSPKIYPLPENISKYISNEIIRFHREISKLKNISNEQIIEKLKVTEEIYWKNITTLFLLNIVEFTDMAVDRDLSNNIERIIELYENLKSNRIDYYELFGLDNTASFDEIKDAYFDYAKKYHPDRISAAPDPEIEDKANFVFAEINKAYETLSNDEKKKEYDTKGYKVSGQRDTIQENLIKKASILHRQAKTLYSQQKYWEAASLLDEAVKLDQYKPAYFLLLGLCQKNIPTLRRAAEKNLQKVIEMEPWNVEANVGMGILFATENLKKRAEGFFRKALSMDPDHPIARKRLDELVGKSEQKKSKFSLFKKKKK